MTARCHIQKYPEICENYKKAECTWAKAQKRPECQRKIAAVKRKVSKGDSRQ